MSVEIVFFKWNAPDGPSTPFAMADGIWLFDTIRVIVITLCLAIALISTGLIMNRAGTLGMKARLLGTTLAFFFFIAFTELEHIGDYAHWRLYAGLLASVVYSWGLWSFYRWESPPSLRIDKEQ